MEKFDGTNFVRSHVLSVGHVVPMLEEHDALLNNNSHYIIIEALYLKRVSKMASVSYLSYYS